MMKSNKGLLVIIAAGLVNLTACSTIKSLFPDKEKDYQFTTEIKPLTLPPDISDNPIFKASDAPSALAPGNENAEAKPVKEKPESADQAVEEAGQEADNPAEAPAPSDSAAGSEPSKVPEAKDEEQAQPETKHHAAETAPSGSESQAAKSSQPEGVAQEAVEPAQTGTEPKIAEQITDGSQPIETAPSVEQPAKKQGKKPENIPVQMVIYDDGESRLRIGAETAKAWRLVGKALSRQSIEVISRNQEELSYSVQYDPEEEQVEDGSLWDEVTFIFGGFQSNDKEYLLKLIENNQQTDVAVLDQDGNPASDGGALRLLKLIQKTIKAD
jgi:outer membrane protein assembly factor BamC